MEGGVQSRHVFRSPTHCSWQGPDRANRKREVAGMRISHSIRWWCVAAVVTIPVAVLAASPVSKTTEKEPLKTVDLFEGMASSELEVTVIAKDAKEGTLTVKNKL